VRPLAFIPAAWLSEAPLEIVPSCQRARKDSPQNRAVPVPVLPLTREGSGGGDFEDSKLR